MSNDADKLALSVATAHARQQAGARLIDIRSENEQQLGMAEGAEALSAQQLVASVAQLRAAGQPILLICQRGLRSQQLANTLAGQGVAVFSVSGGTDAWQAAGLPMRPSEVSPAFLERYSRQLRLPQVGLAGQQALQAARVVLIGAGGLGSPAAFYLAAAGIGHLRLIDDDVVERSNLQRQVLHQDAGAGVMAKVDSARERLQALNPAIEIEAIRARITADNAEALLADADVVLDGADNFPARHALNAACLKLGKPLVYGAVQAFHGQASVFDARKRGEAPCYRCLFPEAPNDAPNCAEAGVLGVVPGIIGLIQASEAIKLILGIGEPLTGRLLRFDALTMRFAETRLVPDPHCPACGQAA